MQYNSKFRTLPYLNFDPYAHRTYGNDDIFSHQIQVKPTHEDRNNRLILYT